MATLAANNLTLHDIAKQSLPNGAIETDLAEMLNQENEILDDMVWQEANGGTFHRSVVRAGIPEPTWRRFYEGVIPVKTEEAQVDEPLGMMEARSVVDEDLLKMSPNPAATRLIETKGIMEGFNQSFTQTLLYGDVSTSPSKFNGLMPRVSSLSAISGEQIVDAGGTGSDNQSILFVNWGPRTVFGIYPRGVPSGLSREDLGVQQVLDSNTPPRRFSAYEEIMKWKCGLVVRDWRHVVRIANVDKSNLIAQSSAAAILELMAVAIEKIPSNSGGRMAIYMSRTLRTMLRIQTMKQSNVFVTVGNEEGKPKMFFDGVPIRRVDQMAADETRVT